jgi:hypothetical protein
MKINNNKIKPLFLLSLVGSNLAKEEKTTNQSKIVYPDGKNLNSLPQLATNLTDTKITNESPYQNVLVAGYPILVSINGLNGTLLSNKCTGSFVIVNTNSSECNNGNDYGGFLTSFFCPPPVFPNPNVTRPGVVNWDNSVSLGVYYEPTMYLNKTFDNWHLALLTAEYVYVSADLTSVKLAPFVPKTTDEGTTDLLPVISSSDPTSPGLPVCVYGAASGTQCGNITEVDLNLIMLNPLFRGDLMLNNLNKVDLGNNGLLSEDIGAPVYTETQIGEHTLAQALGHVSFIDNNDPQHHSFYYTPLEQALDGIISDYSCTYSLLTYNETNAEEWEALKAQIEVPPKK